MKRLLKKYLPKTYLKFLEKLISKLSLESLIVGFIKSLKIERAVKIKQDLFFLGRLDYPHDRILMKLDSFVQIGRLSACKKEPETVAWIEKYMQPGDKFYDIGANVGAYSFVACSVAKNDCLIYAFEPSYSTYNALCENIQINSKQGEIIPVNVVLMDRTSLFSFHYSSLLPGTAMHDISGDVHDSHAQTTSKYTQTILGYRLDDLVSQFKFSMPNLIKVDVDGTEYEVLRGAANILASDDVRTLLVEIDESLPDDIIHFLAEKGFGVEEKHSRGKSTRWHNYIFTKSGV